MDSRVVALIDMDCFYCQVEENLDPNLKDEPIAVVQYNAWQGGGIIAVNYPARAEGVTRHMRGNEAKKKCPNIKLVQVPEVRGKADLTKYRDAGKRVSHVLATCTKLLERASVDEAYLDISESVEEFLQGGDFSELSAVNMSNTHVVGAELTDFLLNSIENQEMSRNDLRLAVGGLLVERIRRQVLLETGYKCSAGVAHNKVLAKLVCSLHKPNQQTILPHSAISTFFKDMPIRKISSLGGKFGQNLCTDLKIQYMAELEPFTISELSKKYDEKTSKWLYNMARGINHDPVTTKLLSKSIGSCKNFPGKTALTTAADVQHWLEKLSEEISERLDKDRKENQRKAKQITVSFAKEMADDSDVNSTRTCSLSGYTKEKISSIAFDVIKRNCMRSDGSYCVKFLGLSAGSFENVRNVREITSYFTNQSAATAISSEGKSVYQESTDEEDDSIDVDRFSIKPETDPPESFFANYFNSIPVAESSKEPTLAATESVNCEVDTIACQTCNEDVPVDELQCHQDYHYAQSLQKEQSRPVISEITENANSKHAVTHKKSKKRKSGDENNKILMSFLKKDSQDDETGEKCPECDRRVKVGELDSHMDYHAAKRLHLELNSNRTTVKKQPKTLLSYYKNAI